MGTHLLRHIVALLLACECLLPVQGATIRVTTWNLQWFPNGGPKQAPLEKQNAHIAAAANVLHSLNPDIILLQEMRDYDACARLAEAIQPHTYQVAVCSAFKEGRGIGHQQVAILAKEPAQAAWSEPWKSMEDVDPPRGFAFGWFKVAGADVGVYAVHLKSNLIMHGDTVAEGIKNIHKREVAARQLLGHIREVIAVAMPNLRPIIIGGDFNTNADEFADDETLKTLTDAGLSNCMEKLPLTRRVTHPASGRYPDATFDYFFARNASLGPPQITRCTASDHLPVTCDVEISSTIVSPVLDSATEVTITQPVTIPIPYGKTVLPRGARLHIVSRSKDSVIVQYMDGTYSVPIRSTDLEDRSSR
jgi:endonuclease/exonuclease/phosphatase family metal-dependent hydrolase